MRKDDHHIRIKNLRTGVEQGFMLTAGDKPFTIQGMDVTAIRIAEWETLYSDFTNSRVFPQTDWSWGISKYWIPEYRYSTIIPTTHYWDAHNILIGNGEFTLGSSVAVAEDFTGTDAIAKYCNGEAPWVVYAAAKASLKIFKSVDHGITWSTYKDYTADTRFTWYTGFKDIVFLDTKWQWDNDVGGWAQALWFIVTKNDGSSMVGKIIKRLPYYYVAEGHIRDSDNWAPVDMTTGTKIRPTTDFLNTDISLYTDIDLSTYAQTWFYDWAGHSYTAITNDWYIPWQRIEIGTWNFEYIVGMNGGNIYVNWNYTGNQFTTITPLDQVALPVSVVNTTSYDGTTLHAQYGMRFAYGTEYYTVTDVIHNWAKTSFFGEFEPYIVTPNSPLPLTQSVYIIKNSNNTFGFLNTGNAFLPDFYWFLGLAEQSVVKYSKFIKMNTQIEDELILDNNSWTEWFWRAIGRQQDSGVTKPEWNNIYSCGKIYHTTDQKQSMTISNGFKFELDIGYYLQSWDGAEINNIEARQLLGTSFGTDENGIQANIYSATYFWYLWLNPTIDLVTTVWDQSISAIHFAFGAWWLASNFDGKIYKVNNTNTLDVEFILKIPIIDPIIKNYIDAITSYNGLVVMSYQAWPWVLYIDPEAKLTTSGQPYYASDVLCVLPLSPSINIRIKDLVNTGNKLLISTNQSTELYEYTKSVPASEWYMQSSIYGGYIANVSKNWLYAYVRFDPWSSSDWQKIAFQVSFDEGHNWKWLPNSKTKPYITSATPPWSNADYYHTYTSTPNSINDNKMVVFFYPYNTKENVMSYRCWIKKWTTVRPIVNHIACHFVLNNRQEMLINYNISLKPRDELLDGRRVDVWKNNDKLTFLKEIWQQQDMVEVTHIDGKKYTCISFSDDRTPWQGFVLTTQNANSARQDVDNLEYNLLFTLKTIANFSDVL